VRRPALNAVRLAGAACTAFAVWVIAVWIWEGTPGGVFAWCAATIAAVNIAGLVWWAAATHTDRDD